jgi:hypothetical protein
MVLGMAGIFGGNEKSVGVPATAGSPAKQREGNKSSEFSPLLDDALRSGVTGSQKRAVIAKYVAASDTNTSLNLVNGLPSIPTPATPPITSTTTTTGIKSTTPTTSTPASVGTQPSALDLLKEALVQAGVDISEMQFAEHQDLVTYPGGSYTNDLISLQVGSHSHEYTANLVAADPKVTVNEIEQLLAGNRG